jgi:surface antigen
MIPIGAVCSGAGRRRAFDQKDQCMGMKSVLALSAALLVAAGCTNGPGPKEMGGAVIGGAAGGLIGSQIGSGTGQLVATAAGVFLGAWLGSEIGRSLDENDRREAERSAQAALEGNPDGRATTWQNPNSGHSGSTTPTRTYETADGPCREYTTSVVIDGKTQTAHGTACREPDGTWRIVS